MSDPQYPIGRFVLAQSISESDRAQAIRQIAEAPARLRLEVAALAPAQLDTPYRDGGWTVRQVVHHVPDSHLNAYTRFKLALSENHPTIRPYDQERWAKLADTAGTPVEVSIALLDGLHARWVVLLRAMSAGDFGRVLHHPESGDQRLDQMLMSYAWHGRHHVGHVAQLRDRMGWR